MLHDRNKLAAAARPEPIANVDTPDMLNYMPPQPSPLLQVTPLAPPPSAATANVLPPPLTGSEPDEPPLAPLLPSKVLMQTSKATPLRPLISKRAGEVIAQARLARGGVGLPPLLPAAVRNGGDRSAMAALRFPPVPEVEEPEEVEGNIAWFARRTSEGLRNVPGQAFGELMNTFSLPWYLGAIAEGRATGRTDGYWYQSAKAMREGVQAIREIGAPERDPEQTNREKLVDPGVIIPAMASFGSQIATMMVGGGAVSAGAKGLASYAGVNMSAKAANRIANAAGAILGGTVEGQNTYFEGIELGMSPGEASAAFLKHAAASGALSSAQLSFAMNQMPAPLQHRLFRTFLAGGTDAISETLDEVAGYWSLHTDQGFKEALKIVGPDAFAEIGPAAFIIGMITGRMGLPPEMALRAAGAGETQSLVDFGLGGGRSVLDELGDERLQGVLEKEADWFRTADGVRHSARGNGGVVRSDTGLFWMANSYGHPDGELLPVRLSDIVEVGTLGDAGEELVTHNSERMRLLRESAKRAKDEVFGEMGEFRTVTVEEFRQRERSLRRGKVREEFTEYLEAQQARYAAEVSERETAELDRFAQQLEAGMRVQRNAAANVAGVEAAVQGGLPEIGPDAPVAADVPADQMDKLLKQFDKIAEAEWQAKIGSARWLGLPESVRKERKKESARRLAGLSGSVTRLTNQSVAGVAPSAPGTFAGMVEDMIANYALTGQSTDIDTLMREDFEANAMAAYEADIEAKVRAVERIGAKLMGGSVESTEGYTYSLKGSPFGPAEAVVETDLPEATEVPTAVLAPGDVTAAAQKFTQEAAETALPKPLRVEQPQLVSGDWYSRLLQYAGSEYMMDALRSGETTVEDVMMTSFRNANKLRFVKDKTGTKMIATPWGAGVTPDTYNANLLAYVAAVREAKTALAYVLENEYSVDVKLKKENAPLPRESGQPLFASGKSTVRKTRKLSDRTEKIAGYSATMKQTSLYNDLVRIGARLGWADNYAAAELASEVVYAQANAWAAGNPGKSISDYYARHLGELRGYAESMTRAEHDRRRGTMGFRIPKEMVSGTMSDATFGIPNEMLFSTLAPPTDYNEFVKWVQKSRPELKEFDIAKVVAEKFTDKNGDIVDPAAAVLELEKLYPPMPSPELIDKMRRHGDLPKSGLSVASIGQDQVIYVGRPGNIHLHISMEHLDSIAKKIHGVEKATDLAFADEMALLPHHGFVDPAGKYYSRAEALAYVQSRLPEFTPQDNYHEPGQLGSLDVMNKRFSTADLTVFGTYDPATKNIELFLGSDLHTVLHEFAHAWRSSLTAEQLKSVGRWANGKKWKVGDPWSREAEEKFANGFVAWAGTGKGAKVPKDLEDTFSRIGDYLSSLYREGRALRPDVKVSASLSKAMEKIFTKQLLRSKDEPEREEGRRRQRLRAEFAPAKRMDLGDHIDAMAEILDMPPQSPRDKQSLVDEANSRKRDKKYLQELDERLKESEATRKLAIDIVDFMIVRDRAIDIRVKFEGEFREAYRKGPDAVTALLTRMANDRTEMDIRFYRMAAGDTGRRLNALTNRSTNIDTAILLKSAENQFGSKSFEVLYQMLQHPAQAFELADQMAGEVSPGLWDLYMQAHYGFRLSSPDVLAVNFIGTGLWTAWQYSIHRPLAGTIDSMAKALGSIPQFAKTLDRFYFRGNPRARDHFNTRVLPLYSQLTSSVPRGYGLAKDIITDKTGGVHTLGTIKNMDITSRDVNSWQRFVLNRGGLTARLIAGLAGKKNAVAAQIKFENAIRATGYWLSLSTTFMRASDMVFKVIAVEGEINRIAQEEAEALFPNNVVAQNGWIKSTTKKMIEDPGQLSEAQKERLREAAAYNTFTDMPLKFSRHVIAARESAPILKMIFPYYNTLVNLGKRGLEMTPGIGLIAERVYLSDKDFKAGSYGHTKADIMAKQIEGALLISMFMLLFDEDEMTGAAPLDPQERKVFFETGKIEYAMKIGDHWYSYANVQPFNVALSIATATKKYILANVDKINSGDPEVQKKVTEDLMQGAWSIGTFLANNDFMRNYEQLAKASTTENMAKRVGSLVETAFVPYNGFLRWMMRTEKMMMNEDGVFVPQKSEGFLETSLPLSHNVMNKLFGLPLTAQNKLTVWGEPYTYSDNKWYDSWMPIQYSKAEMDPVDQLMEELQWAPELPRQTYTEGRREYRYDPEIWQQLALGMGAEGKPALARLIERPAFQQMHKEDKLVAMDNVLRPIRERHRRKAKAAQRRAGLKPVGEAL